MSQKLSEQSAMILARLATDAQSLDVFKQLQVDPTALRRAATEALRCCGRDDLVSDGEPAFGACAHDLRRKWTADEDRVLSRLFGDGARLQLLAATLRRRPQSVRERLLALDLIEPDDMLF